MTSGQGQKRVRAAAPGDARGIAEVHVAAWHETYADLLEPEILARITVERRAAFWEPEIAAGASTIVVAVDGERVVGFASGGAGRDDDSPAPLELYAIYLLASEHGSGLGQGLLDAAVGDDPAYLWVAADNPRAQSFYRRNGFVADGTTKSGTLPELRLVRSRQN